MNQPLAKIYNVVQLKSFTPSIHSNTYYAIQKYETYRLEHSNIDIKIYREVEYTDENNKTLHFSKEISYNSLIRFNKYPNERIDFDKELIRTYCQILKYNYEQNKKVEYAKTHCLSCEQLLPNYNTYKQDLTELKLLVRNLLDLTDVNSFIHIESNLSLDEFSEFGAIVEFINGE